MKVITLIQPWATLIMLKEKNIETRSWSTKYRGQIAIHAGKKIDKEVFDFPPYKEVFNKYNITPENIITSAIIAKCQLSDIRTTEELKFQVSEEERIFGDYSPNRFGWILTNIEPIEPIKNVKGMLGFWNYDL